MNTFQLVVFIEVSDFREACMDFDGIVKSILNETREKKVEKKVKRSKLTDEEYAAIVKEVINNILYHRG